MTDPIVYFDGFCNLCDGFVSFVMARDRHRRYRFAALQGETARTRLPADFTTASLRTIVLQQSDRVRVRSDAALAVLSGLGGPWRLVAALRIIPRPLRDVIYDYVSRKRFAWFGQRDSCRLPTSEEREQFLP